MKRRSGLAPPPTFVQPIMTDQPETGRPESASRGPTESRPDPESLVVRELPYERFADPALEDEWERVRDAAGVDPLFMSWRWLTTWWDVFGRPSGAEWVGFRVSDGASTAAFFPLLLYRSALKGPILRVRRLGVLGGFLRGPETVLTQYRQPVGDFGRAPEALTAMIDHLQRRKDWSELVIQLAPKGSPMVARLREEAAARGWYLRAMETVPSYVVEMQGSFQSYCQTLTPSVRRRLLLQRRRLASLGSVELEYADSASAAAALALLNRLHENRAGSPALGPQVLAFHLRLIESLSDPSSLRLSTLSVSGRPVSVNYALRVRDREYGVAMGFDDRFDSRISLGTLHLGYALEDAWAGGVKSHDLMTSWRGQEGWKAQLANRAIELVDLQLIRKRSLAALYRWYDKLAGVAT